MSAAKHTILIEQGAQFEMELTLKDETNTAIDLTGFEFQGKVRKQTDDDTPIAEFDFEIVAPATDGKVLVKIPTAETTAIDIPGIGDGRRNVVEALYDIKWGPTGGQMKRLMEGTALISAEVTK